MSVPFADCTVWRLMTHHVNPSDALYRYVKEGWIGLGWNEIGDPGRFSSPQALGEAVRATGNRNWPSAGKQIWRFMHEMSREDLVILRGGGRSVVMRVTGDWNFEPNQDVRVSYANRRPAGATNLDPRELWKRAGGMKQGDSIRLTLIRGAHSVNLKEAGKDENEST
ncbi:MAG: hypothetical protein K1X67_10375 [Fimbriimonadaceae bacterium]|nr:hypothetical protein [Fimbriimonadaceae bacterium]